jgi:hypothetical protein
MNEGTSSSNAALGNQGSQDFSSLLSSPAPQLTPAQASTPPPASAAPGTPRGSMDGGPVNQPPQTLVKSVRDGQSGGEQQQQTPPADGQQTPPPQGDQQTQQPPVVPQPTVQQPASVVPAQDQNTLVSSAVEAAIRATRAEQNQPSQPNQQQDRPLTDAEFNQKYGVPVVTPQHLETILGQDPVRGSQMLNQLLRSTMTAALKMSADVMQAEHQRLRGEYSGPINEWKTHQAIQRQKEAEAEFYTAYPDLANEKAIVSEVRDAFILRVNSGQVQFKDRKEAFAAVANTVQNLLKGFTRTPTQQGQNGQQTPTTGQPTRQMSAALSAGRTGTGQAAAPKSDVEAVFGAEAR